MAGQEVIVLQIGSFSNWVGCHWWNIQKQSFCFDKSEADVDESRIRHDYLFREGRNRSGKSTFTPRLIAIDENSKLRSKSLGLAQYPADHSCEEAPDLMWDGNFVVEHREKSLEHMLKGMKMQREEESNASEHKKNDFDEPPAKKFSPNSSAVDISWTDSLRVAFHPKSLMAVTDLPNSDSSNVSSFQSGAEMFSENSANFEDVQDRLRYFSEECDCLQGFNILYDLSTGFAGVADRVMELVQDEYSRKTTLSFPLISGDILPQNQRERYELTFNCTKSVLSSTEYAHMTSPLGLGESIFPAQNCFQKFRKFTGIDYSGVNVMETSAILSAFLESASSSWRLNDSPDRLVDIVSRLSLGSRKLFSSSLALPLGIREGVEFPDYISTLNNIKRYIPSVCLTPWLDNCSAVEPSRDMLRLRYINLRGAKHLSMMEKRDGGCQLSNPAVQLWSLYGNTSLYSSITYCNEPINTVEPFPALFAPHVGEHGLVKTTGVTDVHPVLSTPALSIVESSPQVCALIDEFLKGWNFVKNNPQLVGPDDWEEMRERIFGLREDHRKDFGEIDSD